MRVQGQYGLWNNTLLQFCRIGIPLLFSFLSSAQQIPNSSFEDWTHHPGRFLYRAYDQPDFWTSGNNALEEIPSLDAPTRKSTDAHSGEYAAELITTKVLGQIAPGNLFLGSFELKLIRPLSGIVLGKPFENKPSGFSIWYKYFPVEGDSCILTVYMVRRNKSTKKREVLGRGKFIGKGQSDTYAQAFVKIEYDSIYTPDSIIALFCSSAGSQGENSTGKAGSRLLIDDFELLYDQTGISTLPESANAPFPNPATEKVFFHSGMGLKPDIELVELSGKSIPLTLHFGDSANWEAKLEGVRPGMYFVAVRTADQRRRWYPFLIANP